MNNEGGFIISRKVIFVDNLREDTVKSTLGRSADRLALLIAATTDERRLIRYAHASRERGILLVADNGNAKIIGELAQQFHEEAEAVLERGTLLEQVQLAHKIREHCTVACNDIFHVKGVLKLQEELQPTYFMCNENLTPQVLIELNLDRELLDLDDSFYVNSQLDALKIAVDTMNGELGPISGEPFVPLHAVDYDTAFLVGKLAGETRRIQAIATGLAGIMNDRQFTNKFRFDGKWEAFEKGIPRKYYQSVAVSLGLIEGFKSATGKAPKFHGLGIGSPIAILLLAYAAAETPFFAVDSSAPVKNASMGKLFVSKPSFLTITVEKLAEGLAGKSKIWDCPCIHCQAFLLEYPMDYSAAEQIYHARSNGTIRKEDLMGEAPLAKALPLLSEPTDSKLRTEIRRVRAGHNYWIIDNLLKNVDELRNQPARLKQWVEQEIKQYVEHAAISYSRSAQECMKLIQHVRNRQEKKKPNTYIGGINLSCCSDTTTEQALLLKFPSHPSNVESKIAEQSMKLQADVSSLVEQEDWSALKLLTEQMRGKALGALSRLKAAESQQSQLMSISCGTEKKQSTQLEQITKYLEDPSIKAEVEKKLLEMGKSLSNLEQLEDKFTMKQNVTKSIKTRVENSISEKLKYAVAIGYTGYWGGFLAAFNAYSATYKPKRLKRSEVNGIGAIVEQTKQEIEGQLLQLFSAITSGNQQLIYEKGMSILHLQEERLDSLTQLTTIVSTSTQAALKGKFEQIAEALAPVDLKLGITCRLWILLSVAALYYVHIGALPDNHTDLESELKLAKKLSFNSKIPNGTNVTFNDLTKRGTEFDDKFVEISGFVRNLRAIRTRDGKLLTVFTLYEPNREETIEVACIYEHLGHRGLINSSYVNISGKWMLTSKITDYPVLQIDRIPLSQLQNESWMDHLVYMVRPWFDFYPNSHNISWSIRPEHKGNYGKQSALTGAGEIMFIRPFGIFEKE